MMPDLPDQHAASTLGQHRKHRTRPRYSKLYGSQRWRTARLSYLMRFPLCRDCEQRGVTQEATDVDHIRPHHGDVKLFWDVKNWQPLCRPCHSRKTAAEVGIDGSG